MGRYWKYLVVGSIFVAVVANITHLITASEFMSSTVALVFGVLLLFCIFY